MRRRTYVAMVGSVSLADGTERWRNSLGTPQLGVTAGDGGLFTLTRAGELRALDPATGAGGRAGTATRRSSTGRSRPWTDTSWRQRMPASSPSKSARDSESQRSPRSGGRSGSRTGWSSPSTRSSGRRRRTLRTGPPGGPSRTFHWRGRRPPRDRRSSAVTTGAERCSAFDVATGDIRWQQAIDEVVGVPPAALDTAVVINNDGEAQARDPVTGDLVDSVSASGLPWVGTVGVGRTFVGYGREVVAYTV